MESDQDLLWGDAWRIAEFLGVHIKTVQRWKAGTTPLPMMARRLLALKHNGDVTALMGKEWEGFYFGRDGLFYMPSWKYGFEPRHIKGWFFQVQQVKALEHQLYLAKSENLNREFVRGLIHHALTTGPEEALDLFSLDIGGNGYRANCADK